MSDSEWMTWTQAADLVGCPVPTIDWWQRQGRIEGRPHHGARPSLRRASVEEFALWYRDRDARRARETEVRRARRKRERRERTPCVPVTVPEWGHDRPALTTAQAAALMGVTPSHVGYLCRAGILRSVHPGRPGASYLVDPVSAEGYRSSNEGWISIADAARLVGCSTTTIVVAAREGRIERRPEAVSGRPSLSRASVTVFSESWRDRLREQEAEREERERLAAERRRGPPNDGQVWLDTATAAVVLGITANRVRQLSVAGRIPFTERLGQRWYLRGHVEQVAGARAWRARREVG